MVAGNIYFANLFSPYLIISLYLIKLSCFYQ